LVALVPKGWLDSLMMQAGRGSWYPTLATKTKTSRGWGTQILVTFASRNADPSTSLRSAQDDSIFVQLRMTAFMVLVDYRDGSTRSSCESGLDGIVDVVAIHEFVDTHALLADGVQECAGIAGEDFADGGVAEHGVEAADAG
jgi:hypothetical protein